MFEGIKEVYWISRNCFVDHTVKFDYPNNVEEFDSLLEIYTRKKANYVENDLGENMILDKVVVMDDVSGLADRSNEFANFLNVWQKYGLTCVYIFTPYSRQDRTWKW